MIFANYVRPSLCLLLLMTALLGVAYPFAITAIAAVAWPKQAAGSLVYSGSTLIGSQLIGQNFSDPQHFWGRPSATSPQPYNGLASGGSNLGPTNPALIERVKASAKLLNDADPANHTTIPVDLVTASASGLDPDITPAAAQYQAARVAHARHLTLAQVRALIGSHTTAPLFGILGESHVNVLELNLALDALR